MDLKEFPEEILPSYSVSVEELNTFYGKGNWHRLPDETYKRLRHEPESWTVEVHTVEVYVGTDGDHQDEFLRGNRPKALLRNIVTPSYETQTQVIGDSERSNSKCYMWVHRSGEFYIDRPFVIYEYQKGRDHKKPLEFYKDYNGILVSDSLQ